MRLEFEKIEVYQDQIDLYENPRNPATVTATGSGSGWGRRGQSP